MPKSTPSPKQQPAAKAAPSTAKPANPIAIDASLVAASTGPKSGNVTPVGK